MLTWRVSKISDVTFCIEALQEALARFGRPEIFNIDEAGQSTSAELIDIWRGARMRISMRGRRRRMGNPLIERLWRSLT